jgi:glycosyltransferase involved in cell wall biosynthesis
MAMPAFRSPASPHSQRLDQTAPLPTRRETLAIVSTNSKLCGIAAYTAALRRQLDDSFDITVFDLDQYLLRSSHRRVRKLADRHVKEIGREIRRFDTVNLQLEYGTLGRDGRDIFRRFCWLTDAAPRLSVTFHTLVMPPSFDTASYLKVLLKFDLKAAARMMSSFRRTHLLSLGIARQLRRLQRRKGVSAVVHNRRDLRDIRYFYGIERVFDHPLSYLGADEVEAIRGAATRQRFPMLAGLKPDAVLTGVFGFLNEYKGIVTAIQALRHLPDNHHLLIFGGVHPQEIAPRQLRHPYLSALLDNANIDATLYDYLAEAGGKGAPQLVVNADQSLHDLLTAHPRDLSSRIHFMGALDEADFLTGMAICDAVVFPYLEVGQSSSGPLSQALELGCRIIASRTHTFLEFAEYHQDAVEFFDIGNHLELAERLQSHRQFAARRGLPQFNAATSKAIYLLASSADTAPARRRGRARGPVARAHANWR